jgi:hypothetical protein
LPSIHDFQTFYNQVPQQEKYKNIKIEKYKNNNNDYYDNEESTVISV